MALQHTALGALLLTAGGALADECCCTPTPPPDECTWYLSPSSLIFDCNVQSGAFNINVPTGSNCGWSASVTSGGSFTTITAGSTGNTDGTVEFDLTANAGVDRTGQITVVTTVVSPLGPIGTVIGVFDLTQLECAAGPGGTPPGSGGGFLPPSGGTCTWSISPGSVELTCFPQGSFFNVNTQLGCGWAATVLSGGAFITITSGATGNDAGTVFFSILANAGPARGGQIEVRTTVVSTLGPIGTLIGLVNITQLICPGGGGGAPCTWRANGAWTVGDPCAVEEGRSQVITYAGCGWEATAMDPWITITMGATGLSSGTIVFDIAANTTGSYRTGTIEVTSGSASVLGPPGLLVGEVKIYQDTCAPAACPLVGLQSIYTIESYFDGMIPACVACAEPCTIDPIWDGTFHRLPPSGFPPVTPCDWQHLGTLGPFFSVCVDGQRYSSSPTTIQLKLNPGSWYIQLVCANSGTPVAVWTGTKTTGSSPDGVYNKTGGCAAGPATLTIV